VEYNVANSTPDQCQLKFVQVANLAIVRVRGHFFDDLDFDFGKFHTSSRVGRCRLVEDNVANTATDQCQLKVIQLSKFRFVGRDPFRCRHNRFAIFHF
jgi:hypothetical protein